jgi:hypothetical protein
MRFFPLSLIIGFLYLGFSVYKIHNEVKKYHKTAIPNIERDIKNLENLPLNSDYPNSYVGFTRDSYIYLRQAYSIYLYHKPYNCYRPQWGYFYAPFIFLFNKYFIIAILIFNAVLFSLSFAFLISVIKIRKKLLLFFIVLIVFLMSYNKVLSVGSEPIISSLLMLSLAFYSRNKYVISSLFLFLAGILRGEIMVLFFVFTAFFLFKKLFDKFLLNSFLILFLLTFYMYLNRCTDQSNFFYWALANFYSEKKGIIYEESRHLIVNLCYKNKFEMLFNCMDCYKCVKKLLLNEVKNEPFYALSVALKNFFYNIIKLFILPFEKYKSKFKNFLITFFSLVHFLWFLMVIISIIKSWKQNLLIIISLFSLVILYSLYAVFGGLDASRFKLYILPFEMAIILNYENKSA